MKFNREKIEEIADTMKLALTDEELTSVHESVIDFSKYMEVLLAEDVTGYEPYKMSTPNKNIFQDEDQIEEVDSQKLFASLNDFDGEYFVIKKVMDDE